MDEDDRAKREQAMGMACVSPQRDCLTLRHPAFAPAARAPKGARLRSPSWRARPRRPQAEEAKEMDAGLRLCARTESRQPLAASRKPVASFVRHAMCDVSDARATSDLAALAPRPSSLAPQERPPAASSLKDQMAAPPGDRA
jgi:hypothetical protein